MTTTLETPAEPQLTGAPAVVAEAASVLAELKDVIWAARADGEKMETVAALEELKSQIDAVELEVVHDLDATQAPRALGWASTQDFVTAVAGGHKGYGKASVRLSGALRRPVLAPVAEALRDGWLSAIKAHVIERAIDKLPSGEDVRSRGVQVLLDAAKRRRRHRPAQGCAASGPGRRPRGRGTPRGAGDGARGARRSSRPGSDHPR